MSLIDYLLCFFFFLTIGFDIAVYLYIGTVAIGTFLITAYGGCMKGRNVPAWIGGMMGNFADMISTAAGNVRDQVLGCLCAVFESDAQIPSNITPPSTPTLTSSTATSSPGDSLIFTPPGATTPERINLLNRRGGLVFAEHYTYHPVLDIRNAKAVEGLERGLEGRMLNGVN